MKIKSIIFIAITLLGFTTLTAQKAKPAKGLIAHYLFNGNVEDASNYKNHGAMTSQGLQFDTDRFGNPCGALNFDGKSGFVTVPSSPSLESPKDELTVSTWFKLDQGATCLKWLTVCCKSNLRKEIDASPHYRLQATKVTLSLNTDFTEDVDLDLNLDTWYHYTMVYDGSYVKAFLNGKFFYDYNYSGRLSPNKMPLEIGRDLPGNIEYHSGSLDDLQIYNRALTDREVGALYQDDSEKNSPKPCLSSVAQPNPTGIASQQSPQPHPEEVITTPAAPKPPRVKINTPNSRPYTTAEETELITAKLSNIQNKKDIVFTVNGKPSRKFTYQSNTQTFEGIADLIEGSNICQISVSNKDGEATDHSIIIYKVPQQKPLPAPALVIKNPPVVKISTPGQNPYTAGSDTENLTATIRNISGNKNIEFRINGNKTTDFDYDPATQLFSASVPLANGFNSIEIIASTNDGQARDSRVIRYEEKRIPPKISMNTSGDNLQSTTASSQQIKAIIDNVSSKKDIKFIINGQQVTNFSFDPATRQFSADVDLIPGNNILQITAITADGEDTVSHFINYNDKNHNTTPPATAPAMPDLDVGKVNIQQTIYVNAPVIRMACYDHKKIDGDIVTILLNNEIVFDKITLKDKGAEDAIKEISGLVSGQEYIIVSKAWNLGDEAPNTLTMEIDDGGDFQRVTIESRIGISGAIRLVYRK